MIPDPALALDEIGDAPRGPQARVVPERFRPPREAALDAPQIGRRQPWLAPGASRLLERRAAPTFQLLCPSTHRLSMHPHLSRHVCLTQTALQQAGRLQPSRFQRVEIPSHPGWISHAANGTT